MPEHVRVNRKPERARLTNPRQRLAKARRRHRCVPLGLEQVAALRLLSSQPAERAQLLTAQRVNRGDTVLQPGDVQKPVAEINLVPGQCAKLANPQAVAVGDQNHRGIAVTIAAPLLRGGDQCLDLDCGVIKVQEALEPVGGKVRFKAP